MSDKADMIAAARFAARFFRILASLRARFGIDLDEALIYFAIGRLNFDPGPGAMTLVKPASIAALSEFLAIPRETLRRKLIKLEEKALLQRTGSGYVVRDMRVWRRLAESAEPLADADLPVLGG